MCVFVRPQAARLLILLFTTLLYANAAFAEPRMALIIGNAAYADAPLNNPTNDASLMAQALRRAGFEVTVRTDANQRAIREAVRSFGEALKRERGVGFFYFSGHGVQVDGENYLVPVGEDIENEDDLRRRAVTAAEAVDVMAAANPKLNIVVLDACRNNPLPTGGTRGLSRIDSSANLFVSFATSPGAVALDGEGRNSPYTKHLAASLTVANLNLEETFKRTLKGVYQETRGEQTPWISSSFFGDFVFRPATTAATASPATTSKPATTPTPSATTASLWIPPRQTTPRQSVAAAAAASLAGIYHADGVNPNKSRYRGMTAIVPDGEQVRVTWWIGKDVFSGRGHFAGRMLVVYWGDTHPVIYDLRNNTLDGEWADGKATEQLRLFAGASEGPPPPLGGRYRARGRNADGSTYSGTVSIVPRGRRYHLKWRIGSSSYSGDGTLEGNVLTVNWGAATPVVYALSADGVLKGLWQAGKGEETLVPE
ncbi:MAG: caspase family protein [Xanthobacteraceae bacterium]